MTEHKTWFCDFCNKEVKPFRNGFNELSIELWSIKIQKIRLSASEQVFAFSRLKSGDMCKDCLSKLPLQSSNKVKME